MGIEERLSKLSIKKSKYAEALKPNLNEAIRQALSNEVEKEEQEYFENLANKYVSGKPKSYLWARSIVMDVHISLEFYINTILINIL